MCCLTFLILISVLPFLCPHYKRGGGHLDLSLSVCPKICNFMTNVEKWGHPGLMDTGLVFKDICGRHYRIKFLISFNVSLSVLSFNLFFFSSIVKQVLTSYLNYS